VLFDELFETVQVACDTLINDVERRAHIFSHTSRVVLNLEHHAGSGWINIVEGDNACVLYPEVLFHTM
jgi:hypothetical protein